MSGNFAMLRSCVDCVGLFDERFACKEGYGYEDIEFGHRLILGGFPLTFNADAVVYTKEKAQAILERRVLAKKKAKLLWWYIITHPQEDLPITPLLHSYAESKKKEIESIQQKQ